MTSPKRMVRAMRILQKLWRSGWSIRLLPLIPHLPNLVRLGWRLLRDRRVPVSLKSMVALGLLYMVSPFDIMPDFLLPGLGYLDDLTLLLLIGQAFIRRSPPDVVHEHVSAIGGSFQRKFQQWYPPSRSPASHVPPV